MIETIGILECSSCPILDMRPVLAMDFSISFPGGAVVQPPSARDTRDLGLIPGLGRFPGVGNGKLFQCSYLENSVDIGAW